MVRVWISPEGDWKSYVAGTMAAHTELAETIVRDEGYIAIPGRGIAFTSAGGAVTDAARTLTAHGWVRYSDGYVEGQTDAIAKHWSVIRELAESDVIRFGMNAKTWFDIVDESGARIRSFETSLSWLLKHQPPAGVFREPSIVQQFRRRPKGRWVTETLSPRVRVTRYLRRRKR